ncbi:hypothetical protein MKX03_015016 [Papaver bracteatum]|nr:hypothetical protein MKX03_015016 [Papaver bracteatum]
MGLHPSPNVVGYSSLPRHSCNRHLSSAGVSAPPSRIERKVGFPYEHSVLVSVRFRGRVIGSPTTRGSPLILDRSSGGYPSPKAPRDHLPLVSYPAGGIYCRLPALRMSDAKPRTSLRSYWHTLPKKKEQTPLKTGVRYH